MGESRDTPVTFRSSEAVSVIASVGYKHFVPPGLVLAAENFGGMSVI